MNDAYEPMPVEIMRGLRDLWCTLGGLSNHDKTCIIVPTGHLRDADEALQAARRVADSMRAEIARRYGLKTATQD